MLNAPNCSEIIDLTGTIKQTYSQAIEMQFAQHYTVTDRVSLCNVRALCRRRGLLTLTEALSSRSFIDDRFPLIMRPVSPVTSLINSLERRRQLLRQNRLHSNHRRYDMCNATVRRTTRICAAEMAVRYAALSACGKVHVCHCNSLGGAT